jgi:hypothetical protein
MIAGQAWKAAKHPVFSVFIGVVMTQIVNDFMSDEAKKHAADKAKNGKKIQELEAGNTRLDAENTGFKKHRRHLLERNDLLNDRVALTSNHANDCKHNLAAFQYALKNSYCFWKHQPVYQTSPILDAKELDVNRSALKK